MTICRFYQKGNCRYGRNCRFEHPGENDAATTFSFKEALIAASPTVSNFSFKQAVNEINQPRAADVDMSETSFYNFNSGYNNFYQQQNIIQQQNILQQQQQQLFFSQQQQQQQHFQAPQIQQFNPFTNQPINQEVQNPNQFVLQPSKFVDQNQQQTLDNQSKEDPDFSNPQDLSQIEVSAFESSKFDYRRIPIKPPPKALC